MRVLEQIYTSASRLLQGGGNLGIVAQTRDFPRELAPVLSGLRGYTLLPDFDLSNPASHPARWVAGPALGGSVYVVTQTVFAGADHTGRTTPLTHHIVAPTAEARACFDAASQCVAAARDSAVSTWQDEPQWIDPPHDLSRATGPLPVASPAWQSALPWLADTLFHFSSTGRPAVVVIEPAAAADALAGLIAALQLIPPSLQWTVTVATHVVGVSDFVRDAAVLVTYADSPFLQQCRQRRDSRAPLVLDLSAGAPPGTAGLWGDLIRQDGSPGHVNSQALTRKFDDLELSADEIPAFVGAARVVQALAAAPTGATSEQWKALAARVNAGDGDAAVAAWAGDAAATAVRTLGADEQSISRWDTLSAVSLDLRWPAIARVAAVDAVLAGGDAALDALSRQAAASPAAFAKATPVFRDRLRSFPLLREGALASAGQSTDMAAAHRLATLLPAIALTVAEARCLATAVLDAPPEIRSVLERPARQAVATSVRNPPEIATLGANHREAARVFVIPLLAQALEQLHDVSWHDAASQYRDAAIRAGLRTSDYQELFNRHGRSLRIEEVDAWIADPRLTSDQRRDVETAAVAAGLRRPALSYNLPPTVPVPLRSGDGPVALRDRNHGQSGGIGPIRAGRYLSLLVVIVTAVSFIFAQGGGRLRPVARVQLLFALATVVAWIASEVLLRLVVRSPQQFGMARWARRVLAALLLAGLLSAGASMMAQFWHAHAVVGGGSAGFFAVGAR